MFTFLQLFDHIAECIYKFMKEHNLIGKDLPLGFTFSFPCRQEGLDRAVLTQWTKGFKCEGVEGNDIVRLLHEAIERRGVRLCSLTKGNSYFFKGDNSCQNFFASLRNRGLL